MLWYRDWTIALSRAVGPNGEVTGLDFSENMLEVGKEKLNQCLIFT